MSQDLAEGAAVPGRSQRGERKGRGLTLQGWRPGIEVVRWGSIDQQEGSEDQLVDSADWSYVTRTYTA